MQMSGCTHRRTSAIFVFINEHLSTDNGHFYVGLMLIGLRFVATPTNFPHLVWFYAGGFALSWLLITYVFFFAYLHFVVPFLKCLKTPLLNDKRENRFQTFPWNMTNKYFFIVSISKFTYDVSDISVWSTTISDSRLYILELRDQEFLSMP